MSYILTFRLKLEILHACRFCMEVRHYFQIAAMKAETQAILLEIHQSLFAKLGLTEPAEHYEKIQQAAIQLAHSRPDLRSLYTIRAMAAEWLLNPDSEKEE